MRTIYIVLLSVFYSAQLFSQQTQFRGLNRDGIYHEEGLLREWPEDGPKRVLLKEGLGTGFSQPLMHDGVIYITGRRDSVDILFSLDLKGNIFWQTVYGKSWDGSFPVTRNTPTIDNDRIYVTGGSGEVSCIDAITGQILFQVNTHEKFKGKFMGHGMSESLLIYGKSIISSPVGEETVLVALNKEDGSLIWQTESIGDIRSYASPVLIEYKGRSMILALTRKYLVAVDPDNGNIIWKYNLNDHPPAKRRNHTNNPLFHEGEIFVSCGYDEPAVMLSLCDNGDSVTAKWESTALDNHHGGVLLVDGYIYGSNWLNNGHGNWVCLEWQSGKVMYEEKWVNKGSIIFADGMLYLYEEKAGNVGLVSPSPDGFNLKSSFQVSEGSGLHFAHPSVYDGYLLIRHGETLLVYDVKENRK